MTTAYPPAIWAKPMSYWSAYPGATTTEIVSAGRVEVALEQLRRRAATLGPEAFKAEYESFLTSVQRDL